MAHKTLINGTAYGIKRAKTLVGGTAYSIKKGRTLVSGTGYNVVITKPLISFTIKKGFSGSVWGTYTAEQGMTWYAWCNSSYNTSSSTSRISTTTSGGVGMFNSGSYYDLWKNSNFTKSVTSSEYITSGYTYYLMM